MLDAGFTLRKWHPSDSVLEEQIAKYEKAASGPTSKKLKILGVPWDKTEDKSCMDLPINSQIGNNFVATKRNVLRVIASIFDPIGLLSPVTVVFKMFFQILCISKLCWDEPLSEELKRKWINLMELASKISISVPRYYFHKRTLTDENIILHCFCDASKRAYASVIYITIGEGINKTGQLVACKTKVAPIQPLSITQLELSACLLLTKLNATVTSSLEGVVKISKSYFWCDAIDCLF